MLEEGREMGVEGVKGGEIEGKRKQEGKQRLGSLLLFSVKVWFPPETHKCSLLYAS